MCLGSAVELPVRTRGQPTVLQPMSPCPASPLFLPHHPAPAGSASTGAFPPCTPPPCCPSSVWRPPRCGSSATASQRTSRGGTPSRLLPPSAAAWRRPLWALSYWWPRWCRASSRCGGRERGRGVGARAQLVLPGVLQMVILPACCRSLPRPIPQAPSFIIATG